jgi:hypothetical protein
VLLLLLLVLVLRAAERVLLIHAGIMIAARPHQLACC